jgi:glycosyltransferase involved in cell wall biosynthesis
MGNNSQKILSIIKTGTGLKLKIAILGTRGIPNHYGGYEQAATFLSEGLLQKGHSVTVYNSHNHPHKDNNWKGVEIVHCYDPEYRAGTAGQFIYDLNCIRHARKQDYDVLLLMGYTSSSIWGSWYPGKPVIISNMDGLEWKRPKYSRPVQRYLKYAEKLAVKYSDHYIADSPVIRDYLQKKYHIQSCYIPYGAVIHSGQSKEVLNTWSVKPDNYYLLIARMEPENNIETILDGFVAGCSGQSFVVVGNTDNKYGKKMRQKFGNEPGIIFTGALFDQQQLHSLRSFCSLYFHGHSVGGTNPSLLEAMASGALIAAHDNVFNKDVLGDDAYYFSSAADISQLVNVVTRNETKQQMTGHNIEKIRQSYNWETVTSQYEQFIVECYTKHQKGGS